MTRKYKRFRINSLVCYGTKNVRIIRYGKDSYGVFAEIASLDGRPIVNGVNHVCVHPDRLTGIAPR